MYNYEVKLQFITNYSKSKKLAESLVTFFNRIEPYEIEWRCDICKQSTEEIERVLGEVTGIRANGQKSKKDVFMKYIDWCVRMGYRDRSLPRPNLESVGIERLKRSTVTSPAHLQAYLDGCCAPEPNTMSDNVVRCALWLAFSGLTQDKALKITASNLDFENMYIHYEDRDYPIYRESILALKACATLQTFDIKGGHYKIERANSEQLLRLKSETTIALLSNRISQIRANAKDNPVALELGYKNVWLSGIFYRAHEMERAGIKPDFMEVAGDMTEGKTYLKYGEEVPNVRMQRKYANDFLIDYERWKEVYSV